MTVYDDHKGVSILKRVFGEQKGCPEEEIQLPMHGLFRLGGDSAVCVVGGSGLIWATTQGEKVEHLHIGLQNKKVVEVIAEPVPPCLRN